jgi:hypothetical protein
MLKQHPFGWTTARARPWLWLVLLILTLVLSQVLGRLGEPLQTSAAPAGIVSFELARTVTATDQILTSWPSGAWENAFLLQGVDFLYLFIYPLWFSLSAVLLGARLPAGWQRAAHLVAWIVLWTGPLDAIENVALIRQLLHGPATAQAQLAWLCASLKFGLLGVAALFLLAGLVVWGGRRLLPRA